MPGLAVRLEELEPYYDEAERLLHVNRFANERRAPGADRQDRAATTPSWRSEALPLGLKPEILEDEQEAKHFDGYASVAGYKADAERNLIEAIEHLPNFTLLTKKKVIALPAPETGARAASRAWSAATAATTGPTWCWPPAP